jgi:hypothetical protein
MNNILQKTKLNTLKDTSAKRYHNSTDNRLGVIVRLEPLIKVLPILLQLLSSSWVRLITLIVDTQQVVENNYNYMQLIISKT